MESLIVENWLFSWLSHLFNEWGEGVQGATIQFYRSKNLFCGLIEHNHPVNVAMCTFPTCFYASLVHSCFQLFLIINVLVMDCKLTLPPLHSLVIKQSTEWRESEEVQNPAVKCVFVLLRWFRLFGKPGKPEKDRGEILLDIQFLKGSLSASMFDLSSQDKSRSKLGKLKDKLRGRKREGLSDSASAIVPSVTQVMTDSEEEEEEEEQASGEKKKKNKLKSLFAPKSSLQRNTSQSMSTLSAVPERDSAIASSASSGLNAESPEGKTE